MELLAWTHRHKSPVVSASTIQLPSNNLTAEREIKVTMMPRSFWDQDPSFLDLYPYGTLESFRRLFAETSFDPNTKYVAAFTTKHGGSKPDNTVDVRIAFDSSVIRGAEIVEALTAATRAEDLADAFAWIQEQYPPRASEQILRTLRNRTPTRAINNAAAYMIMRGLGLSYDVQLTGLVGAAHLNGREGVIRYQDPANSERYTTALDDGTCVSVRADNFVHIRRGEYKRMPPQRPSPLTPRPSPVAPRTFASPAMAAQATTSTRPSMLALVLLLLSIFASGYWAWFYGPSAT